MNTKTVCASVLVAAALAAGAMAPAFGHGRPGGYGYGMGPGMVGPMPCPGYGMMGPGYGMMGPGYGMMGPGYGMMGPGYGMAPGYGMMGPGYGMAPGYGMMGPGYGMAPGYGMMRRGYGHDMEPGERNGGVQQEKDLSSDDVRAWLQRRLALQGNDRLKVGEVKEVDADTIVAEIVTKDGSLVDKLEFDRHSGAMQRVD